MGRYYTIEEFNKKAGIDTMSKKALKSNLMDGTGEWSYLVSQDEDTRLEIGAKFQTLYKQDQDATFLWIAVNGNDKGAVYRYNGNLSKEQIKNKIDREMLTDLINDR